MIIPVILCGGSGKRLWPLSTEKNPKQFIKLINNKSLLELTLERAFLINKKKCILIGSKKHKKIIMDKTKGFKNIQYFFEEVGRNTSAPICLSAMEALRLNEDSDILIMPSDHYISDNKIFAKDVFDSTYYTKTSNWVTFGIKPLKPSIAYGYIKSNLFGNKYNFISFEEKPNLSKAKKYFKANNYFWNSGIFLGKAKNILKSFELHATDIYSECLNTWKNKKIKNKAYFFDKKSMKEIRSESVDYAVLEKESLISFSKLNCDWSDLGSWDSILDLYLEEKIKFNTNYFSIDSKNNLLISNKKVGIIGVEDLIFIENDDNIIIIKKGNSEKVKQLVEKFLNIND